MTGSKRTCEHHHWTQHIGISFGIKFNLKQDNYDFSDYLWLKSLFPIENKANEHRHQIQYIWISLGRDFDLKQISLIVCITFTQKLYSQSRAGQININIKCNIFELVWALNFILKRQFCFFWPKFLKKCISGGK